MSKATERARRLADWPVREPMAYGGFGLQRPRLHAQNEHDSRLRQIPTAFVANNNTPTAFKVKMLAVYLSESNDPDAQKKLVNAIWCVFVGFIFYQCQLIAIQ